MTCIIAYDIEDDKTRSKVAKFLESQGVRLQKSVFIVKLEERGFKKFQSQLGEITTSEDSIAIFRLCSGCERKALKKGNSDPTFYVF